MQLTPLTIPKDSGSELYFDPNLLSVGFRPRPLKPTSRPAVKVMRVVVQCFGWTVEDRFFAAGTAILVGSKRRNTFRIPTIDLPERHPLITYSMNGSVELRLNRHFTGVVQRGTELKDLLEEIGKPSSSIVTVKLPEGSRGCLEHGTLRIYFEEIADPERVSSTTIVKTMVDPQMFRWVVISIAIHALIILIAWFMPRRPEKLPVDVISPQFQKIIVAPQRIAPYEPKLAVATRAGGPQGMEGEGARAPGEEGRRGKGVGSGAKAGAGTGTRRDVSRTGLLDILGREGKGGALSELFGGEGGLSGAVDKAFSGAPRYGLPGEREYREGKGLVGTGTGGGGASVSIGQGLGTKGIGGGAKGSGLADFGSGRAKNIAVSASIDEEEVLVMGAIPKDVIDRIIRNHMGEIEFCYQRQLQVEPDLGGKVLSFFVIGLEGSVTSTAIRSSTLGSPRVEQCIQGVLRRLQFPSTGGGIVEVTYPFMFRRAG